MKVLKGKQGVLAIRIDGVFQDVLCAVEVSFQFDHEEILKTSRNSGKFIERETRLCDWGINLTGLTKIDNTDGQVAFFWLLQQSVRGTAQYVRLRYTDDDSNVRNITGYVLIKQGQLASVVGGFSMASVFFPGTGAYDPDNVEGYTPSDLYKIYLATTPGAYEVSDAALDDALEIMLVLREDGGYKEVSGAPSGKQFKYTDQVGSGKITFDSTMVFNPGEIVYVQYRK